MCSKVGGDSKQGAEASAVQMSWKRKTLQLPAHLLENDQKSIEKGRSFPRPANPNLLELLTSVMMALTLGGFCYDWRRQSTLIMKISVKRNYRLVFNTGIQPLIFTVYPKSQLAASQSISICVLLVFHLKKYEVSAFHLLSARNKQSGNSSSLTHAYSHKR